METARPGGSRLTPRGTQGTVVSPIFSKITGRDAIQRSYESLFQSFPDWTMDNERPLIDGERVAVPFTAKATHAGRFMGLDGTGRRCEIHGILLMEDAGRPDCGRAARSTTSPAC